MKSLQTAVGNLPGSLRGEAELLGTTSPPAGTREEPSLFPTDGS